MVKFRNSGEKMAIKSKNGQKLPYLVRIAVREPENSDPVSRKEYFPREQLSYKILNYISVLLLRYPAESMAADGFIG